MSHSDMPIEVSEPCSSSSVNVYALSKMKNKRVVFIERPGQNNPPRVECFQFEECEMPSLDLKPGQCVVRTLFVSVDPAQRCRMNECTGVDYLSSYYIGQLVDTLGGIGVVEFSAQDCPFKQGDLVTSVGLLWPWSRFFTADQNEIAQVNLPSGFSPSIVVSCVGLPGMTALLGIRKKGEIDVNKPQTFVVSGAAGSCGSLAGQIARIEGCTKVIGICGSRAKCEVLTGELDFDAAINYNAESVVDKLVEVAPEGVDIYFDNVGGFISDAVISMMNNGGRIILCGQISVYNTDLPYPPPIPEKTAQIIAERNIKRERFLVLSYKDDIDASVAQLSQWLQEKKLKVKETIYVGLEMAPSAFVDMMSGINTGKMMIRVE